MSERRRPAASIPGLSFTVFVYLQDVIFPLTAPIAPPDSHISVLRGNLAPGSAVIKLSGKKLRRFVGPAKVFNTEAEAFDAIQALKVQAGDAVVIRYEGPKGAPGMPEMLGVTGALIGAGLGEVCASCPPPPQRTQEPVSLLPRYTALSTSRNPN